MQFDAICPYFVPFILSASDYRDFPVVPSHILGQAEGLGEAAKFTLAGSKLMTEKRLTLHLKINSNGWSDDDFFLLGVGWPFLGV